MGSNQDDIASFGHEVHAKLARWISLSEQAGNISPEENAEFHAWLSASPDNRKSFSELKAIWRLMGRLEPVAPAVGQWPKIVASIQLEKQRESGQRIHHLNQIITPHLLRSHRMWIHAYRVAAILVVAVGIYFAQSYVRLSGLSADGIGLREVTTVNAQRTEVGLPDGTIAYLNVASKLSFPEHFSGSVREVRLEGEAYFEVEPEGDPFVVRTSVAVVRDLSTEFNVKARDGKVQVVVRTGRVAVHSVEPVPAEEVELVAGEMTEVEKDRRPSVPKKVDVGRFLAWRKGILVFDRTPLPEVTKELERQYNIQSQISDPILEKRTVTGTFEGKQFDDVLSAICLALDLRYRHISSGVLIFQ